MRSNNNTKTIITTHFDTMTVVTTKTITAFSAFDLKRIYHRRFQILEI